MYKGDFLVVNYGHLGDAALSFVFNQNLKRFFPDCNIFSIVSKSNIEFFEKFDCSINKFFLYNENFGFNGEISVIKSLNINTVFFLRGVSKKPYCDIFKLLKKFFPKTLFVGMIKEEKEKEQFDKYYLEREKNISVLKQIFNFVKFLNGKQDIIIPRITVNNDNGLKDGIIKNFDNGNPIVYVNLSAGSKKNIWNYIRRNLSTRKYFKLIKMLIERKYNIISTASFEDFKKAKIIRDSFKEFKNFVF
jgi:ADP-heptose:LPS heptosyltransferase